MLCRSLSLIAIAASVSSASVAPADARALLDHALPAIGSTAPGPPTVALWFSEEVEPVFSGITVTNAKGVRVDEGKISVVLHDARELNAALKPLSPGAYEVHWHAVSVDTHRTQGQFTFTVAPG